MGQCNGITKKGERCKIRVETNSYCHYHVSQQYQKPNHQQLQKSKQGSSGSLVRHTGPPSSSPKKLIQDKPGYIYLYTLSHLISAKSERQQWLKIHKANATTAKVFNPKKQIMIKIGSTTHSVPLRIKQWEFQCQHQLTLINPYNTAEVLDPMSLLMAKFVKLNLVKARQYKNFQFDQLGFKCNRQLLKIEFGIHAMLRELYGAGTVYCEGCVVNEQGAGTKGYNIHKEWFLIPRKDIDKVFKIIDKVIQNHG